MLRVVIWLCMQLLATLSGVVFLWTHAKADIRLDGDTTLAVFNLDTSAVAGKMPEPKDHLALEETDGIKKVVIKSKDPPKIEPKAEGVTVCQRPGPSGSYNDVV